jgi:hypothetical protein
MRTEAIRYSVLCNKRPCVRKPFIIPCYTVDARGERSHSLSCVALRFRSLLTMQLYLNIERIYDTLIVYFRR